MRHNRTVQGQVIMEELRKCCSHPTAEEIFGIVRCRLPRISKGTVYRNLDKLSARGDILCLTADGRLRHYDGNITPHFHMRCDICGRVYDISFEKSQTLHHYLMRMTRQLKMKSCLLEFSGQCESCQGNPNTNAPKTTRSVDNVN